MTYPTSLPHWRARPRRAPTPYRLIERPAPILAAAYDRALDDATDLLARQPGLVALYQIGGVSAPGISDLDLVAVFEDDVAVVGDPSRALRTAYPSLFIHNPYGASRAHFERAQSASFFHNYRLLWGADVRTASGAPTGEGSVALRHQIALEYLVKMYVTASLQRAYRAVNVRSLLLHVKAVAYDLEFLDVHDGPLYDLAHRVIGWRERWFHDGPSDAEVADTFDALDGALVTCLDAAMARAPFYLPGETPYRIARNLWLRPGSAFGYRRSGVRLPAALAVLGTRYVKASNRLGRFDFTAPVASGPPPSALAERFGLVERMGAYNRQHLPGFGPLTSSL